MLEADLLAAEMFLDRGAWGRVREPAEAGAAAALASGERLIEPVGALLIGRAALGSGQLSGATTSLGEAVAMARVAGATGTLSVARAAFDQALLLSGRRPRSRRPLGSGIALEAIEAENHGLASMMADGNEEAVASFRDAVELWRSPRMDGLARSRARHARGGAPSLGRSSTGRVGAHPGAEGAGSARDAGRESRCDPRADRFRREDRSPSRAGRRSREGRRPRRS